MDIINKMAEKKETKTETKAKKGVREIVVPGEVIGKADDFLPGDFTAKSGEDIIATRLGIADKSGKIIKIIPISGVYVPRRGNIVIGSVLDITMRGWIVDIKAPYDAFLLLKECPMFVNESEMADVYSPGDLVIAKIFKTSRGSIDLTTKGKGLGKIRDGIILEINPHKVPRVIGKEGSMIKLIKTEAGCEVTVGQNGLVWIKGEDRESEVYAKAAVEFVIENTIAEGLTDKVQAWFKENKKGAKK
jgi:exosome complex component RRP4